MERPDPNPFPRIKAVELGRTLIGLASYFPSRPEIAYPSERRKLPEPTDGEAFELDLNGYAECADQLRFEL